jgi:hypothetical protein
MVFESTSDGDNEAMEISKIMFVDMTVPIVLEQFCCQF